MSICWTTPSRSIAFTTTGATSLATDCMIAFASLRNKPNSPGRDAGASLGRRRSRAIAAGETVEGRNHALDEHIRFLDGTGVEAEPDVESIVDTESGDVHQRTETRAEREALFDRRAAYLARTADTGQRSRHEVDRVGLRAQCRQQDTTG